MSEDNQLYSLYQFIVMADLCIDNYHKVLIYAHDFLEEMGRVWSFGTNGCFFYF